MMSLALGQVTHGYGGRPVLQDVSLEVPAGRALVIMGRNGAGKSTLLRLLALLELPDRGEVLVDGAPVPRPVPLALRRQVALVFQQPLLFHSSVFNNVAYGLKLRGLPRREIRARTEWAMDLVGLTTLAARDATRLSGGESQLVSLARALAIRPAALLLDEPGGDLDQENARRIAEVVRSYHETVGASAVLVTHDLLQARSLASQAVLLKQGRIAARGSFDSVLRQASALVDAEI